MRCNCENSACQHVAGGCEHGAGLTRIKYLGVVCDTCASRYPAEYHIEPFIRYEDRPLPKDPGKHPDPTRRVRKMLGVSAKMPAGFNGVFDVDGHIIMVYRSGETPFRRTKKGGGPSERDHGKGRYMHRIFHLAPDGKMTAIGRMHQAGKPARRRKPRMTQMLKSPPLNDSGAGNSGTPEIN